MQDRSHSMVGRLVAGLVLARCRCCAEARELQPHAELDASRRFCPGTLRVYLDRGDGLFEDTGTVLSVSPAAGSSAAREQDDVPDILSDRPRRTDEKTRIRLERATFAGSGGGSAGR